MQKNVPREYLPDEGARPDAVSTLPELHYPRRFNLVEELLDVHVEDGRGDEVAIYFEDRRITYAELLDLVNRFGNALVDHGIEPGDRVAIRFPNRPEGIVAALATQRIGGVVVPTMRLLRGPELSHIIDDVGAKAVVVYEDLLEEYEAVLPGLETVETTVAVAPSGAEHDHRDYHAMLDGADSSLEPYDTDGSAIAVVFYTSGTTGRPKGAVHTHCERLAITDGYARYCVGPTREDVFGGNSPLPFSYGYGAFVTIPFRFGASVSLIEDSTPASMLRAVEDHGVTVIVSVPTAYNQLLSRYPDAADTHDVSSLRLGMSAGEPLPPATYERVKSVFGIDLLDGIGTTEMGYIFISHRHDDEIDPTATGFPVPGYECRVVDPETGEELPRGEPGLLAVKGPTGITYWNRPAEQTDAVEDGWNYPGDIYVHRTDGRFEYKSRRDDIIISAGYKIAAPDVENAIIEHGAVHDVGVVGSPDPERNEIVKAYVVPAEGVDPDGDLVMELQEFVKQATAPYKYPREIDFVDDLPRTETGKVRRNELRELDRLEAAQ